MPKHADKYLYEHPQHPGKMISRQRLWALRQRDKGRCPLCGKRRPRDRQTGSTKPGLCPKCKKKECERKKAA